MSSPLSHADSDRLAELVYDRLRELAGRYMKRERRGHTLQPTELVHEAYVNLAAGDQKTWQSRTHFLGVASRAMRQVLVAYARRRGAQKREGGARRVPLSDTMSVSNGSDIDILNLEEALSKLEALDDRKVRVVELRFFGGMTIEETATALEISPKTVEKDWYTARAWLHRELGGGAS